MITNRLENEKRHALEILKRSEAPWGWGGAAGEIRKKRRIDFLCGEGGYSRDISVLEIGCGTGLFTCEIAKHFQNLWAVDISQDLINVAKDRLARLSATFAVCDAHQLPFENNKFDLILGCSVLHHLNWNAALVEFSRVLKPGGSLRFCEPNLANPQIYLQKNWPWLKRRMGDSPDEYAFTSNQIKESLVAARFSDIEVSPFEFLHPSSPKLMIKSILVLEEILEKTIIQKIAGSLKISARKRTDSET